MNSFMEDLRSDTRSGHVSTQTMVLEKFSGDSLPVLTMFKNYVDVIKIGWGIPLMMDRKDLERVVSSYNNLGISVSNGGTLLEIADEKNKSLDAVRSLKKIGFTTVEISEGVRDMKESVKKQIAELVKSEGMKLHFEVGRKNPKRQLTLDETVDRINRALDYDPDTVIIEGRESGMDVEIYDERGEIRWDWVERIMKSDGKDRIMFEAPLEKQQTALILHLGSNVRLGNVSPWSVAALESQRLGLRGDTFGMVRPKPISFDGSPAMKFVLHVLENGGPMDQSALMAVTGMNRRTVQMALQSLLENDMVSFEPDIRDLRRKIYRVAGE